LAAAAVAATSAGAEIIKKDDMLRGITTTRDRCAATPQTLWLNVDKQDFASATISPPPVARARARWFSAGRSFHHGRHKNLAVDTDLQGQKRRRYL